MVDSLTTVTLYGALPTDDPIQPGASNTHLVTPIGTASDGSETTYLDEVVIYGPGSTSSTGSSTTQLADTPVSTWRATLVEGASAYAIAISHPDDNRGTAFSCNLDSKECVRSEPKVFTTAISSTATTTFTSASTTQTFSPFSNINIPIATLTVPLTTSEPVPTSTSSLVSDPNSSASNRSIIGRAVGGAIGGSALLVLICFSLIFCSRHYRRRRSYDSSRSLPQITSRSSPQNDHVDPAPSFTTPKPAFAYHHNDNASVTYSESELKDTRPSSLISASGLASDSRSVISDSPYTRMPSVPYANSQVESSPHSYNEGKPMTAQLPKRPFPLSSPLTRDSAVDGSPEFPSTTAPTTSPIPRPQRSHSRFIERLSLNSTKLDVLMTLASIESARNSKHRATSAVSVTSDDTQAPTDPGSHMKHPSSEVSGQDDSTTLQGSSFQESTLASGGQSLEDSSFPHPASSLSHSHFAHGHDHTT